METLIVRPVESGQPGFVELVRSTVERGHEHLGAQQISDSYRWLTAATSTSDKVFIAHTVGRNHPEIFDALSDWTEVSSSNGRTFTRAGCP